MGDSYSGVGFVDVLPTGSLCAEGVDAKIGRVDVDLDGVVDFRVDEDAGEGGVAATRRVEGTFPDETVYADFRAEKAIGVFAFDLDRGTADASDVAGVRATR